MTAQVRAAALLAGVDAHYAREQKRSNGEESSRRLAVALFNRLADVRQMHGGDDANRWCPECHTQGCDTVAFIDRELVAE